MALAVNLPRDWSKQRANLIVAARAGGRAGVLGDIGAKLLLLINDHTTEQIRVEVVLIVDDDKGLRLDSDGLSSIIGSNDTILAENTIVEWCLVLPRRVAHAGFGMGPVDFLGLTNRHANAVLPVIGRIELGVILIVVAALETDAAFARGTRLVLNLPHQTRLSSNVPFQDANGH